jgi:hypothetical protein
MTVNQNVYTAIIKGDNNVSIDWNFTKNVLHLFVLMLYVQAILFFLLIHPLLINTSLNNTQIPEVITAISFP